MTLFLLSVSPPTPLASEDQSDEDHEIHVIAICDRPVWLTLGMYYHYSLEYWCAAVESIVVGVETSVADFQENHAGAVKVEAVELLAELYKWKVYEYKSDRWLKDDAWDEVRTSVSVIHRSATGKNIMPLLAGDRATVRAKWDLAVEAAQAYEFGEQSGYDGEFCNWCNSVYYAGWDVNNSNTFVRAMIEAIGLTVTEMKGGRESHPGRLKPLPITTPYSSSPWKSGADAPPAPTEPPGRVPKATP